MVAKIWKYFAKVTISVDIKRKCLKCGAKLDTPKDKSTANMINHLKTVGHEKLLEEYKSDENVSLSVFIIY